MKTRSRKRSAKTSQKETPEITTAAQKLDPSVSSPPQVFILPKDLSEAARILTLPNPATSNPSRYLLCPHKGFFEFTRIAGPKKACRSWLLAPDRDAASLIEENEGQEGSGAEGYVLQTPDMMIATPMDPLFVLLPALAGDSVTDRSSDRAELEYLSPSDYMERLGDTSEHFRQLLRTDARTRLDAMFERRMQSICDTMDAGDERLYSLSKQKLLAELVEKAQRMVKTGLPVSMEDRFVKRELAIPILSVKREESGISAAEEDEPVGAGADSEAASQSTSQETQSSVTTSLSASTAATSVSSTPAEEPPSANNDLAHLLRLRTALSFILNSCIAPNLRRNLEALMKSSPAVIDFTALEKHLAHINELKKEAQALRSMSDNISRKRTAIDDDEALEKAEAKRRKKEEDEIKKKNTSRGVQQLKKADTSGMKKLSAFFSAKPATKKP